MKIGRIIVGALEENCYLLSIDNKCLLIDPGAEASKIIDKIGNKELLGILITHHHFDHVGALEEIKNKYNTSIYDFSNLEEKEYQIDKFNFDVIYNPGHTNDSISFYFKEDNIMFVGDFIFLESIGRCDLGGNIEDMKNSINKIKKLNNSLVLYPGHGNQTTLEHEKKYNPFF